MYRPLETELLLGAAPSCVRLLALPALGLLLFLPERLSDGSSHRLVDRGFHGLRPLTVRRSGHGGAVDFVGDV